MSSALALAGLESPRTSGAVSPPPHFPTVRQTLTSADYSIAHPPASDITASAIVRHAIAQGHLEQAATAVERQMVRETRGAPIDAAQQAHVDSGMTPMEARLLDQLLDKILSHPDATSALAEAETKAAAGSSINQATIMARLVGVSNRICQADGTGTVKGQVRSSAEAALAQLLQCPTLFPDAQHPVAWADRVGAQPTTRVDRLLSLTAESLILTMQNERIDSSNRSHERIAQRTAKAASPAHSLEDRSSSRGGRTPDASSRPTIDRVDMTGDSHEAREIVDVEMEVDEA